MNKNKLITDSLIMTIIFTFIYIIYMYINDKDVNILSNIIISILLFLVWGMSTKIGTYYTNIYNSQIF